MSQQTWATPAPATGTEFVPELDLPGAYPQRRWTVLLRWLLVLPQVFVLAVLGFVGFFVLVFGWFAALVLGRLPGPVDAFLGGLLRYQVRVGAYAMLLVDRYPPFSFDAPEHPVQVELRRTELNRLAVLFRLILMIPAAIVQGLLFNGWYVLCFFFWIIALVLGRLPEPVFGASAAVLRFGTRYNAYVAMLTSAYPKRLFGDESLAPAERRSATRPLLLTTGAKVLVVVFLALGLVADGVSSTVTTNNNTDSTTVTTVTGTVHSDWP